MTAASQVNFRSWEKFEIDPKKKQNPFKKILQVFLNLLLVFILIVFFWGLGTLIFSRNTISAKKVVIDWASPALEETSINGVYFEISSGFKAQLAALQPTEGLARIYNIPIIALGKWNRTTNQIYSIPFFRISNLQYMWQVTRSLFFVIFVLPLSWFFTKIMILFGWSAEQYGERSNLLTFIFGLFFCVMIIKFVSFFGAFREQKKKALTNKLQHKVNKIKEKYKDDSGFVSSQRQQAEINELYKKHGINPFASALQSFAFAPLLMSIYSFVRFGMIAKNSSITNFNLQDSIWSKLSLAFQGQIKDVFQDHWPLILISLIYAGLTMLNIYFTTFWSLQKKSGPPAISKKDKGWTKQKIISWVFKIVIFVFFFTFPLGTSIYWVFGVFFDILQRIFLGFYLARASKT